MNEFGTVAAERADDGRAILAAQMGTVAIEASAEIQPQPVDMTVEQRLEAAHVSGEIAMMLFASQSNT